ncbi:MAG: succinylglutamate-semialdehyde dehydrogenase [Hyphomonadaceae bacterium TMED5]|nr:succinylglutamate-semialdehyde dehydrogenase [Ponticaulis sp.]OUX97511.1 MAG: succinylglutamate-semialdehyde dehydrogenase [Hyphomonadaceae bacterium TMED5]|tara:strand:+ start:13394 stop:14845 length:1452 start_codon:yes stop_codon:yes gene_type:complete
MSSLFIDGQWMEGRGDVLVSTDPSSGTIVWEGGAATSADVELAYAAARRAFSSWAMTPVEERIAILRRYVEILTELEGTLPELISREVGKVLWETRTEIGAMKGKVELSINAYAERTGHKVTETAFGQSELVHRPHGVMAVMGPFNFPGHLPNGHIVPALLAGNTIVFKPSELAPATGEALVRAMERAGLPAGVLNLVQGGRDTGAALLDGDLDGVLFTGSATTGTFIHQKFGGRPEVMLALEMGGNNPLIAWDFSDVEAAADIAAQSAYLTSGQRCTCARRLIVPEGKVGDDLVDAVIARASGIKIGAWDEADVFMGSVVNAQSARNAVAFQEKLEQAGGKPLKKLEILDKSDAFVSAGVIDMTDVSSPIDEELFGPFLQVYRVPDFDTAIASANWTKFGLAGGLISDSEALWKKAHIEMKAGILNFNRPTAGASSALPFGGPGVSGNHRPSAWYAADYCAWPQASQISFTPERMGAQGFPK